MKEIIIKDVYKLVFKLCTLYYFKKSLSNRLQTNSIWDKYIFILFYSLINRCSIITYKLILKSISPKSISPPPNLQSNNISLKNTEELKTLIKNFIFIIFLVNDVR